MLRLCNREAVLMNDIPIVRSREYKMMLDHRLFADRKQAAARFWAEAAALAGQAEVKCVGEFDDQKSREIVFLDTPDLTINLNGLLFRQRRDVESDEAEYTLKCRSPDRYLAAGAQVQPAGARKTKVKLEEDIAAPFVVRFSHSGTTKGLGARPKNLKQATKLFPTLGRLRRDDNPCSPTLALQPVNALCAYERVLKGPVFQLHKVDAEVALILWTDGKRGRPLVAEFSFRYESKTEQFSAPTARMAMQLFDRLQRLDWFSPEGQTKTRYVYRAN
jgi:hypothetical protein